MLPCWRVAPLAGTAVNATYFARLPLPVASVNLPRTTPVAFVPSNVPPCRLAGRVVAPSAYWLLGRLMPVEPQTRARWRVKIDVVPELSPRPAICRGTLNEA